MSETDRRQPESPASNGEPRISDPLRQTLDDERVAQLLEHTIDVNVLAGAVDRQEAADAADTLETLEEDEAADVLEQMEDARAAEALAEMQMPLAVSVLEDLIQDDPQYANRLLELMAPDDAADLLQAVDEDQRARLRPDEQLIELAAYDAESAGGMMTTDFIALRERMSIGEAIEHIRGVQPTEETNYALVTDEQDRLVGLITLRQILLQDNRERVADHMETDIDVITPDVDREEVARTFDRYDYSILPVVDRSGRLLGIVTVDDVIDIIREEQTEDVQKSVGAGKGEMVYSTLVEKIRGRIGWLGMSLGMMCGSAAVILLQADIVETHLLLAFLLPVIAAVVGNGGQQAMMVTMRGIVLDEIRRERITPLLMREVSVGLLNGLTLGALILLGVAAMHAMGLKHASISIGIIAAIAMVCAMTVATLTGSGIPLLMRRLGIDPAMASSIILIMITDFVSFFTLLTLTRLLIHTVG